MQQLEKYATKLLQNYTELYNEEDNNFFLMPSF